MNKPKHKTLRLPGDPRPRRKKPYKPPANAGPVVMLAAAVINLIAKLLPG